MPAYSLFGADIRSEIPLPGLPAATSEPAVTIRFGSTPDSLVRSQGGGVCYSAASREALITVPNVGRFHVRAGEAIVVDAVGGVDLDHLRLFLLTVIIGVLLHQRDELVLHAAVVDAPDGCIALAGESSAGKSTLAAVLQARGRRVLTDEICVVRVDDGPIVIPGPPCLHVWEDALRRLGHDPARFQPVRPGMRKYAMPMGASHQAGPRRLKAIYVLSPWNSKATVAEALGGRDRFEALVRNTYRFEYLAPMGLRAAHFARLADLAARVPVVRLRRSSHAGGIDELDECLAAREAARTAASAGAVEKDEKEKTACQATP